MQAARGGVVAHHADGMVAFPHFADRGAGVERVQQGADARHPAQIFGAVLVEEVVLHFVGVAVGA